MLPERCSSAESPTVTRPPVAPETVPLRVRAGSSTATSATAAVVCAVAVALPISASVASSGCVTAQIL